MSSNDYTQVRDYLRTRIAAVDSNYQEWVDSIEDIGNIPQTILDRSYHITIGTATSDPEQGHFVADDIEVTITTFKRAFNDIAGARDVALQAANCIRLDVINAENVEDYKVAKDGNIEDVNSVSITPTEINETNDNIIKVETVLNVRLFIGIT